MKLSEAIRLGSMLMPQCYGRNHVIDSYGKEVASCAIGAAADAIGEDGLFTKMKSINIRVGCPECTINYTLSSAVVCLNDVHHWTRERIADWVEVIEIENEINRAPIQHEVEIAELAVK